MGGGSIPNIFAIENMNIDLCQKPFLKILKNLMDGTEHNHARLAFWGYPLCFSVKQP